MTSANAHQMPALLGESPAMLTLKREIAMAASADAKVLILGETGAGKEVVAQLIHAQGERRLRPFVAVNCSGIPETLLESELFGHVRGSFTGAYRDKRGLVRQADRGTLFLDELGEMSLRMQAVLLRFTETGEIQPVGADMVTGRTDVRLITATNRDLRKQIEAGQFREDLYYRLNIIHISVPPLRERAEDIRLLLRFYLERASQSHRLPLPDLTPDAEQLLYAYRWPGNVRELKNVTERLVLRNSKAPIAPDDLPAEVLPWSNSTTGVPSWSTPAGEPRVARIVPAPREAVPEEMTPPVDPPSVDHLWQRLTNGEDFWTVVHRPFKAHELTRQELAALIDRGLQQTRGSYRALLGVFGLPPTDYKRFHAFLYQQNCNLPVGPYRAAKSSLRGGRALPAYRSA